MGYSLSEKEIDGNWTITITDSNTRSSDLTCEACGIWQKVVKKNIAQIDAFR